MESLQIAYIGGGSMNWAWQLMRDLALEPDLSGVVRLYDIDAESAKMNAQIGNSIAEGGFPGKWRYEAKDSLQTTLVDADFVVVSILPGTFDEMASDVHVPEAYGIYQSVGDTTGPGGIVRAMRTIPMFAVIGEAIKAYAPKAWVINYTNPMANCTGALYSVFPDIKAFGCCHEVFHAQKLLAAMLEKEHGTGCIPHKDILLNVSGVNHFTWLDGASYKHTDLLPLFADFAAKHAETGFALEQSDGDKTNSFRNMNRVCFDLFRRFGSVAIPAAGDRHIAEFMPPWYLDSPETVENWGFGLTKVSWRKQNQQELLAKRARILAGAEAFEVKPSGEEGTTQIKALCGLTALVTNVNLPNVGQAAGLPLGAIVETNAVFSRDSVRPVFAGTLPPAVRGMMTHHAESQRDLVDAGLRKDLGLAFAVFLRDNLMTLPITQAEELFAKMTTNTKAYLEGWK